jgi:hypothetical protein
MISAEYLEAGKSLPNDIEVTIAYAS